MSRDTQSDETQNDTTSAGEKVARPEKRSSPKPDAGSPATAAADNAPAVVPTPIDAIERVLGGESPTVETKTAQRAADAGAPPAAQSGAESSVEDEPPPEEPQPRRLTPHQMRRRQRQQRIVFASVLAIIFLITLWGTREVFTNIDDKDDVLGIAPCVLFDQICADVKKREGTKLHTTYFAVDDTMIPQISELKSLKTVIFDRGAVTDLSIESIATLPELEHLRLRLSPISDKGLETLSKVETLWYLNLPHCECTSKGVAALAALPQLRQLRIGSPLLGNEVTREIAAIDSLRGIHLIGVPITDEGLKTLAAMPHLESLYLDDSAVTEAGWQWLFREHPHLHVHIDQFHHDRDPKAHRHH